MSQIKVRGGWVACRVERPGGNTVGARRVRAIGADPTHDPMVKVPNTSGARRRRPSRNNERRDKQQLAAGSLRIIIAEVDLFHKTGMGPIVRRAAPLRAGNPNPISAATTTCTRVAE